jgi:hypothetical protein
MKATIHIRRRRAGPAAIALASITLLATACAGASPPPRPASNESMNRRAVASGGQDSVKTGASAPADGQGQTVGTFTVDFAKCMRANGVPNFPDPNGQAGQLGPDSGIDPNSPQFQSALTGPCKSLAPPAWLNSGPDSVPGGGR